MLAWRNQETNNELRPVSDFWQMFARGPGCLMIQYYILCLSFKLLIYIQSRAR